MEIFELDAQEYKKLTGQSKYIYNAAWFHKINCDKVDKLYYLLFKAKKNKFSAIAGVKDNIMKFPYSAPFSILEKENQNISIEDIDAALYLLQDFAEKHDIVSIQFRLPPSFYDENYINKFQNCLMRNGYAIETWDLNYQYNIHDVTYLNTKLKRNAKKNLHTAETYNYQLLHCENIEQKKEAYEIIAANRKSKGYPLRMTWEQVYTTIQYIEHDFFLLQLNEKAVASAVIFKVTDEVYQVIYWGDLTDFSEYRPMNYLSYHLYEYYCNRNVRMLDIGPSTEDGIPNYGLCSFKEGIGCDVSSKLTFHKKFRRLV